MIKFKKSGVQANKRETDMYKEMYILMFKQVTNAISIFKTIKKLSQNLMISNNNIIIDDIRSYADVINGLSDNEIILLQGAQESTEEIYIDLFSKLIKKADKTN